jgi:hypothetical protein
LGVCVDVCCNDSTCPSGTVCADTNLTFAGGDVTGIRACLAQPAPANIVQK